MRAFNLRNKFDRSFSARCARVALIICWLFADELFSWYREKEFDGTKPRNVVSSWISARRGKPLFTMRKYYGKLCFNYAREESFSTETGWCFSSLSPRPTHSQIFDAMWMRSFLWMVVGNLILRSNISVQMSREFNLHLSAHPKSADTRECIWIIFPSVMLRFVSEQKCLRRLMRFYSSAVSGDSEGERWNFNWRISLVVQL